VTSLDTAPDLGLGRGTTTSVNGLTEGRWLYRLQNGLLRPGDYLAGGSTMNSDGGLNPPREYAPNSNPMVGGSMSPLGAPSDQIPGPGTLGDSTGYRQGNLSLGDIAYGRDDYFQRPSMLSRDEDVIGDVQSHVHFRDQGGNNPGTEQGPVRIPTLATPQQPLTISSL
jgi:hypothetical protein